MNEWWNSLGSLNQFFFGMAAFFSVFFIWQVLAAFMGMTGDDMDVGADSGDFGGDAEDFDVQDDVGHSDVIESAQAFKILSIRSLVTFFTLFSWGGALYLSTGMEPAKALGISSIWGLVGMFSVAFVFYGMAKLAEVGTKDVKTCKGNLGTVYLDIPADGYGEIRTTINGASEHVKAKSKQGEALPAGTEVRVVEVRSQTLVEVERVK